MYVARLHSYVVAGRYVSNVKLANLEVYTASLNVYIWLRYTISNNILHAQFFTYSIFCIFHT